MAHRTSRTRNLAPVVALALALAGCRSGPDNACLKQAGPVVDRVVKAVADHQGCATDADCHLVDPSLPCAKLCPAATSDPAAVARAVASAAKDCPDCTLQSTCASTVAYCDQTAGLCDTCRDTGQVGDHRTPGDDCWAPPVHRCADVDPSAPTVWACPPAGATGDCCRYDRGCLPCGWSDCSANPTATGCATVGTATDGGTPACPTVPHGTVCFDAERYP